MCQFQVDKFSLEAVSLGSLSHLVVGPRPGVWCINDKDGDHAVNVEGNDSDGTMQGATRGVTVSMSVFLTCHQCYCAGSSLAWGFNLRAVVCGIF